jgi:23S rRNA (uracil1939-C5)-methyltransferase
MPSGIIESLDHEARGVTRLEGKTVFVEGALPGERVEYASYRRKPGYELAQTLKVLTPSVARVTPRCPLLRRMRRLQHAASGSVAAQASVKQRVLEDALWHIGRIRPESVYAPLVGPGWGYRYRARLSVRHVPRKGGSLVGFRERKGSLRRPIWITARSCRRTCPQCCCRCASWSTACRCAGACRRSRSPSEAKAPSRRPCCCSASSNRRVTEADKTCCAASPTGSGCSSTCSRAAGEHFAVLAAAGPELAYLLPDFGLRLAFAPNEFTQVNHAMNRVLLRRAMSLLAPKAGERIADMFCGLGNFSLPIARRGRSGGSRVPIRWCSARHECRGQWPAVTCHLSCRQSVQGDPGKPGRTGPLSTRC